MATKYSLRNMKCAESFEDKKVSERAIGANAETSPPRSISSRMHCRKCSASVVTKKPRVKRHKIEYRANETIGFPSSRTRCIPSPTHEPLATFAATPPPRKLDTDRNFSTSLPTSPLISALASSSMTMLQTPSFKVYVPDQSAFEESDDDLSVGQRSKKSCSPLPQPLNKMKLTRSQAKQRQEKQRAKLINTDWISQEQIQFRKGPKENYFEKCFTVLKKIGSGSFSDVYKVRNNETQKIYAIKISKKQYRGERERGLMIQEVETLASLRAHIHILELCCAWEEDYYLYIQTNCAESSLHDILDSHMLDEEDIWKISLDVLLGLQYVHSLNKIHMDVKPSNILLIDGRMVLGDFGLTFGGKQSYTDGDSRYLAPEMLLTKNQISVKSSAEQSFSPGKYENLFGNHKLCSDYLNTTNDLSFSFGSFAEDLSFANSSISSAHSEENGSNDLFIELNSSFSNGDTNVATFACDVYAMGATMLEMAGGFSLPSHGEKWHAIRNSEKLKELLSKTNRSQELRSLIFALMDPNPLFRPTVSQVLSHPKFVQALQHRNPNLFRSFENQINQTLLDFCEDETTDEYKSHENRSPFQEDFEMGYKLLDQTNKWSTNEMVSTPIAGKKINFDSAGTPGLYNWKNDDVIPMALEEEL